MAKYCVEKSDFFMIETQISIKLFKYQQNTNLPYKYNLIIFEIL